MKLTFRPAMTLAIGGIFLFGGLVWRHSAQGTHRQEAALAPTESGRPLAVSTRPVVMKSSYTVKDHFMGELETARQSALGFELSGTVDTVHVDEGDHVAKGQALARLDRARLEAEHQQQLSLHQEAQASLTLAESTFKRVADLASSGAVSVQDLDEATQQRDAARASVTRVEAAIRRIEVDLAKSLLVAPYAGRIASRRVDEGTIVQSGEVLLQLIESDRLEARVGVTLDAASDLAPGDLVTLRHPQGGTCIDATVRQISPQQNRRTRTLDVMFTIKDTANLVPGDLVEWVVETPVEAEGTWLPRSALTSSTRGLWAVYITVATEDDSNWQLERREVEVLHLDDNQAFVRGALREGLPVVTEGLQRLVPGQRVAMAPDQDALVSQL